MQAVITESFFKFSACYSVNLFNIAFTVVVVVVCFCLFVLKSDEIKEKKRSVIEDLPWRSSWHLTPVSRSFVSR